MKWPWMFADSGVPRDGVSLKLFLPLESSWGGMGVEAGWWKESTDRHWSGCVRVGAGGNLGSVALALEHHCGSIIAAHPHFCSLTFTVLPPTLENPEGLPQGSRTAMGRAFI